MRTAIAIITILLGLQPISAKAGSSADDPRCATFDGSTLQSQLNEILPMAPSATEVFASQAECVERIQENVSQMTKMMTDILAGMQKNNQAPAGVSPEPFCILEETSRNYIGVFVAPTAAGPAVDSVWQCQDGKARVWH